MHRHIIDKISHAALAPDRLYNRERRRFIVRVPDLNSPRLIDYVCDYALIVPRLWNVTFYPLAWEHSSGRCQDFLSRVTYSRVGVVGLVRECFTIYTDEIQKLQGCSSLCIQGAYTREECRSGKDRGLSRKSRIYLRIISPLAEQKNTRLAVFEDPNLILAFPPEAPWAENEVIALHREYVRQIYERNQQIEGARRR